MNHTAELLHNFWYVAAHGSQLEAGKTLPVSLLGVPLLLGRDNAGKAFSLRDFCPHRGIPLRYGKFDGQEIEGCYLGWGFDTQGACTKVPSLAPDDKANISRIKVPRYECVESEGLIWVFMPPPGTRQQDTPEAVPLTPGPSDKVFKLFESVTMPCHIDHAVIGLMDPAHGPYVHEAWWWRSRGSMHVKQKQFKPHERGFKMVSHKPSSNSRAYKILGGGSGERVTEISFQLPGLRTEHITIGNKNIVLLTALTPVDETTTVLHQFIYSDSTFLNMLLPILKPFGKAFINQDLKVVKMQQEGFVPGHPALMLLGDADQQALWYFKLKRDWLAAQENNVPFENRVKEKQLSWRS
jgi:phenylpropionate dioxygenase-like ring-hydroxylating dioxygenase large terminal subunit